SNNLPYVLGWATLPWIFWAALRLAQRERTRDAAVLGLLLASAFLGGDAQATVLGGFLVALALLIHGVTKRRVALSVLSALVATACMGAELVPALMLAPGSSRSSVVGQ